jgi:hypothetical protein
MIDKLVIAINVLWLWCCLAPALLCISIGLIRFARNAALSSGYETHEANEHRHRWVQDHERSSVDIPPVEPNPPGSMEGLYQPDNWFGIFHDVYVCSDEDCDEEKEKTHRSLY